MKKAIFESSGTQVFLIIIISCVNSASRALQTTHCQSVQRLSVVPAAQCHPVIPWPALMWVSLWLRLQLQGRWHKSNLGSGWDYGRRPRSGSHSPGFTQTPRAPWCKWWIFILQISCFYLISGGVKWGNIMSVTLTKFRNENKRPKKEELIFFFLVLSNFLLPIKFLIQQM